MKAMNFGFSAVASGQKGAGQDPMIIATSTEGSFRLTGAATTVLGILPGNHIMFVTNVPNIDAAIFERNPQLVAWCESEGLDISTAEAAIRIHKEFDTYGIAKGILKKNSKNVTEQVSARPTKQDKIAIATENYDEYYANAMAATGEDAEKMQAALSAASTHDERVAILATGVEVLVDKYMGSKCANPGNQTGSGLIVTFTDSSIWNRLKADVAGAERETFNRSYMLDTNSMQTAVVNNGFENVEVQMLVLGEYTDAAPIRSTKGAAKEVPATESVEEVESVEEIEDTEYDA